MTDEWTVQSAHIHPRLPQNEAIHSSIPVVNDDTERSILSAEVNDPQPSALWPSDHFMILTDLILNVVVVP